VCAIPGQLCFCASCYWHQEGGIRTLGIPTVLVRLIKQALFHVLQPEFDPEFCRYDDDCNTYVGSEVAGRHAMTSFTDFLERKLRLQGNWTKSAVARPGRRKFLGYSFTWHKQIRLKIADSSIARLKNTVRDIVVGNASRKRDAAIAEPNPVLRGWTSYLRLNETKRVPEELDSWIGRKLRFLLWRQWKRPATPEQAASPPTTGRDARVEIGEQRTRPLVERARAT
jgi:hypothetical protein